ncbi:hypothetical protein Hanom_Chr07g00610251 [Helianthus anomalus]
MEPLLVKENRVLRLPPWIPVRSTSADLGVHVPEFSGSKLILADCDVEEVRVRAVMVILFKQTHRRRRRCGCLC